jgi:DNA-binding beta-propeller fold protein YncE
MSILRSCARFLPPALCLLFGASASGQVTFQYQFNLPFSVAVHSDGSILVTERGNNRVHKYSANGMLLWRAGTLQSGSGNDEFREPGGLAVDSTGQVYVADTGNARVQKLSPATGASLARWGSSGTGAGQFRKPIAIAIDSRDHVYVLDAEARRVQKFANDGAVQLGSWGGMLGSGDREFSPIGGGPGDIVVDSAGNAYISDTSNHRIHKWRLQMDATGTITGATFAGWLGKCVSGASCDSGGQRSRGFDCTSATCVAAMPGTSPSGSDAGQFANPRGLALDPAGNLFVADVDNNRIQKFDNTGAFATQWGFAGSFDGQFRGPLDVATAGATAVFVADMRNGRVVKFSNTGQQQSVLGGGIALTAAEGWPPDKKDALLDPSPFFIVAGESHPTTITVHSLGQFGGPVTLSAGCPSPVTVGSGCIDLLTGLPAAPTGTTVNITPNPVSAPAGSSENTLLTVTASGSATLGKFIRPLRGENQPAGIVHEIPIAFEIIAAPTDNMAVPCSTPSVYQRGTLPEILPLAPLLKSLYRDKHSNLSRSRPLVIGVAATASKNGWQMKLEKPRPGDLPLSATESVIVFDNPTNGTKGIYGLNTADCSITKGVVLDAGMKDEFRISTANTTTLFLSVPRQDMAILSEPSFWQLVGGRRVTFEWVIDH